jgi:hypothetical protein
MRSSSSPSVNVLRATLLSATLLLGCSTAKTVRETYGADWARIQQYVESLYRTKLPPLPQLLPTDTATRSGVGVLRLGMSDTDAMARCLECRILSPGGEGRILRLSAWSGGLEVVCSWNRCSSIKLSGGSILSSSGWTGSTDKGIRIGSSFDDFQKAHPSSEFSLWRMAWIAEDMVFRFTPTGRLTSISIGSD